MGCKRPANQSTLSTMAEVICYCGRKIVTYDEMLGGLVADNFSGVSGILVIVGNILIVITMIKKT